MGVNIHKEDGDYHCYDLQGDKGVRSHNHLQKTDDDKSDRVEFYICEADDGSTQTTTSGGTTTTGGGTTSGGGGGGWTELNNNFQLK